MLAHPEGDCIGSWVLYGQGGVPCPYVLLGKIQTICLAMYLHGGRRLYKHVFS